MINVELQKRILSSIILIPLVVSLILLGSYYLIFFTTICFFVSLYEWNKIVTKIQLKFLGALILFFSFFSFYKISTSDLWFFVLLICISTDIGGYVFGKLLRGPKLTKISPNKTYSGMLGSYFFSLIVIAVIIYFNSLALNIEWFIVTVAISTVSQIGDITISYFKRLSKVKNTGKLIPGHGGLLDRIDGMIFAFPFYYFILSIEFITL
ncbi:phosphatidate cytidylyltransferase [Candidatus Pelagibacter sp.]|nr:phosphatidate cytidylyltransferase [Candidatus Pelagibacter sp.]